MPAESRCGTRLLEPGRLFHLARPAGDDGRGRTAQRDGASVGSAHRSRADRARPGVRRSHGARERIRRGFRRGPATIASYSATARCAHSRRTGPSSDRSASATTQKAGTLENTCPSCGAPIALNQIGECRYCSRGGHQRQIRLGGLAHRAGGRGPRAGRGPPMALVATWPFKWAEPSSGASWRVFYRGGDRIVRAIGINSRCVRSARIVRPGRAAVRGRMRVGVLAVMLSPRALSRQDDLLAHVTIAVQTGVVLVVRIGWTHRIRSARISPPADTLREPGWVRP